METLPDRPDAELLRSWSVRRCQASFRALVARHLGLVRGLALRKTGDAALADEIAQSVFACLAVKAGKISAGATLAPWLHHCAWCETAGALRRESRRRRHMNAYADHLRTAEDGREAALHRALPHLDDALRTLSGDDQRIVLMRFYEGRGLREIAGVLGKTEAAVRKQGQRALEKMALSLRRRGAVVSAGALAAGLGAVLTQPVSAAAVAAVSMSSATAAMAGAKLSLLDHVLTLMNTKTKTALLTAACMAVPLAWQWQRASGMEDRLAEREKESSVAKNKLRLFEEQRLSRSGKPGRNAAGTSMETAGHAAAGSASDWEAALKNPDPLQRSQRLAALIGSLSAASAPEVDALFKRLHTERGGSQFETDYRHFLRAWGRLDGEAALAACAGEDGRMKASSESMAALAGWAQQSPEKARAWLEAQEPGEVQTSLALGIIDGWSLTDFDAASAYANSLPRSTVRDQFRDLLLQRALATGGESEARRWFDGIPNDEHNVLYKQRAFDELLTALVQRDPAAAAEWITRMGRQPFMSGNGIPELATKLAATSPGQALRWLEAMGPGEGDAAEGTKRGYAGIIQQWSGGDATAAGAWLQTQAGHPAYDGMAAAHARQLAAKDGAAALAWADTIQNPEERANARAEAARAIARSQGPEAETLLAAAGFSPDEVSKFRNSREESLALQKVRVDMLTAQYALDVSRSNVVFEAKALESAARSDLRELIVAEQTDAQRMVQDHTAEEEDSSLWQDPAPTGGCMRLHPNARASCASCHPGM